MFSIFVGRYLLMFSRMQNSFVLKSIALYSIVLKWHVANYMEVNVNQKLLYFWYCSATCKSLQIGTLN